MSLPDFLARRARPSDCILWTGATQSKGYGCVGIGGNVYLTHRVAWEDANGSIPDGLTVDHLCKNRLCLNVAHMELVTRAMNSARKSASIEYCDAGHELSIRTREGREVKYCRECAVVGERATRRSGSDSWAIRRWAVGQGIPIATRGRIPLDVRARYAAVRQDGAA